MEVTPNGEIEEKELQGNYNDQFPGVEDTPAVASEILAQTDRSVNLHVGSSYVLFTSYDRGGACPSAVFGLHDQTLTLLYGDFGPDAPRGFQLSGRFVSMPHQLDYKDLLRRLHPSGGALYAPDDGESWCPGP